MSHRQTVIAGTLPVSTCSQDCPCKQNSTFVLVIVGMAGRISLEALMQYKLVVFQVPQTGRSISPRGTRKVRYLVSHNSSTTTKILPVKLLRVPIAPRNQFLFHHVLSHTSSAGGVFLCYSRIGTHLCSTSCSYSTWSSCISCRTDYHWYFHLLTAYWPWRPEFGNFCTAGVVEWPVLGRTRLACKDPERNERWTDIDFARQVVLFTPGEIAAAGYTGYLTNRTITGLYAQALGGAVVMIERELEHKNSVYIADL